MRSFLILVLFLTTLSADDYFAIQVGSTDISRDYSVEMVNNGVFLNKETGEKINGKKGEVYNFNEKLSDTRLELVYGFQNGKFGDFYEVGFYTGSVLDELFLNYGMTFPNVTFSQRWFNPYLKGSLGFGYTGAKFPQPNSYSYSLGLGFLSTPFDSFQLRMGIDKIKRVWSDISHSYGSEKWEEDETNIYFGGIYLY